MADFDRATLKKLSDLCCIHLSDDEMSALEENLRKILGYMELLSVVDTDEVPICSHVNDHTESVLRDDVEAETLDKEAFLANAPSVVGGMIKVPPVIRGSHG